MAGKLISADEARAHFARVAPVGHETVPLAKACDRVLGPVLLAPHDLPSWPRSAMDGFAVRASDVAGASLQAPVLLRRVGAVPMGGVLDRAIAPGECAAISTGGVVPEGADTVVMIENTRVPGGDVAADAALGAAVAAAVEVGFLAPVRAGANVIARGEDFRQGAVVLPAGRRLRAQDLAALAAFGQNQVEVGKRPRVAILSTGNEVVPVAGNPGPGQVRDTNQHVLGALAESAGCLVTLAGHVPDDASALAGAIEAALAGHDAVLLSGGSSVGVRDLTSSVLEKLSPGIAFHGIRVKPGRPSLLAFAGQKPIVGLPGTPAAAVIIFEGFVRAMLEAMGGVAAPKRRVAGRARMAERLASQIGREDHVRIRLEERSGEPWAVPVVGGTAAIGSLIGADGIVVVADAIAAIEVEAWCAIYSVGVA